MKTQTNNLDTEIQVMQEQIQNVKATAEATQKQNTAEHLEIKTTLVAMNLKLDSAVINKADKDDLKTLDSRTWGIVVGMLMLLAGVIAAWFKK